MRGARRGGRLALVAGVALVLSGCQTTSFYQSTELARSAPVPRILLMPTDIELSEISAGGIPVPNAEWTASAEKHLATALAEFVSQRNAHLATYKTDGNADDVKPEHVQLVKLHGAVGTSILLHKRLAPYYELPNKKGAFDWTLGPTVKDLRQEYDADYALFVYLRDSYASGGRVVAIVVAAALGVGLRGGSQVGFASLVDLNSGDIVWFNVLARATGDLRQLDAAKETVAALLENFPK